jgi:F420-0:gamma-glutamyl ligase-like protein
MTSHPAEEQLLELAKEEPILQFFSFSHLPPHLQEISCSFGNLAGAIATHLPRNPERTVALRKLLEAKDAAVRARLYK